ncbi:N-acetyltransferase [Candidatus Neomarinimicrobiota bacterium]
MQIIAVTNKSLQARFIDLPYMLYANHPYWVPPLRIDTKTQLSPKKNPFFKYADHILFLATEGGHDVGRIGVFHNRKHNDIYNVNVGMFGYLDMVDDPEVTRGLFDAAQAWLAKYNATEIIGPFNPDINGTMGLLVSGYDAPPMVQMTYNEPYYREHLEGLGMTKAKDVYAWDMYSETAIAPRIRQHVERIEGFGKFIVRKANLKNFEQEAAIIKAIYNQAWAENWGALWLDDQEFDHIAQDLKLLVDPDLSYIAEVDGQPAGVSITLPNINEALKRIPNGRLFPSGLLKLLWYKRRLTSLRVLIMGVVKDYRHWGIDAVFYLRTYDAALAKGYKHGEMSWILEDNDLMNNALEKLGAKIAKTYRIYRLSIESN